MTAGEQPTLGQARQAAERWSRVFIAQLHVEEDSGDGKPFDEEGSVALPTCRTPSA
jgi:hypothetical protein